MSYEKAFCPDCHRHYNEDPTSVWRVNSTKYCHTCGQGNPHLEAQPITLRDASAFITRLHRHHVPPRGWKFGIGANDGKKLVGVVTVGRPVSRHNDDGWTAEVNRLCTDGTKNAPSFLYAAAWRACRAMGYRRLITYILETEPGTTLRAAGWKSLGTIKGKSWNNPGRPRTDKAPTCDKQLFEVSDMKPKGGPQ